MQTPKSSPTTTAITESHYTPASRPIPSPRTFTQNINTTIRGKNIGKCTSIRRAAFALVSVFLWGAPPSLLPPKVTSQLRNVLPSDGDDLGIPEALGPCPPALYPSYEPYIINPYSKRDEDLHKKVQPVLNGINEFLIKPLLMDPSIFYPDSTGTDPNLVYDFKALAGLDELTAEPPAPVGQF